MSIFIKRNLHKQPKIRKLWAVVENSLRLKQWLWFGGLWVAGLLAVTVLTYPFKFLIRVISAGVRLP